MTGRQKFRVPTIEEMEKAEAEDALAISRPIFKRGVASKSTDGSATSKSAQPEQQGSSPPKRMISQKALLSRQPLSSLRGPVSVSGKKQDSPKPPSSIYRSEAAGTSKAAISSDLFGHQRVSRVTRDNITSAKPTVSSSSSSRKDDLSPTKAVTSKWTGGTLGSDSRNAGSLQRQDEQPSATISASATEAQQQKQPAKNGSSSSGEAADKNAVRADVLPTLAKLGKTSSLVVSSRQRGNPILNFVRNVPWEYGNIVPDYVMGASNCALFLSLRYHQLNPEYIHERLKQLGHSFDLRVLLVQVDIKDPHHLLKDLAKICILADCTLMLAFSAEEAGRYLETYKVYENKAAEAIMERTDSSFGVQLSDCLTRVKAVNKTDCSTLLATFGSLQGIMKATTEDLSLCPGFGPRKAKRLHDVFHEPFLVSKKHRGDT